MSRTIGVILSGCGVQDGSEIHEATLTLLYLQNAGVQTICFAPDNAQAHVVNHLDGKPVEEQRNVLIESARIARGEVQNVRDADPEALDGLVLPGGFGAALNLCSFASEGADCSVEEGTARLLRAMYQARKPIGAMCIAPAVVARVLGEHGISLTIGNCEGTAAKLEAMGARHVVCSVDVCHIDREHKIISTPAYMLAEHIGQAAQGIEQLVQAVVQMA